MKFIEAVPSLGRAFIASIALFLAGGQAAHAQDSGAWPSKPIRLIVPYAPGGGTDIVARLVADKLGQGLGRPVIVDNRPGGRSIVAYESLLQDKADGHTFLLNNSSHGLQAAYKGLRYDPATDFVPVSELAVSALVFVVSPNNPARTLPEFVTWTRQRPGKVSFGSFGVGKASRTLPERS
jgi:tripartite-type tricarboxylate transporter receptor subunit TctC